MGFDIRFVNRHKTVFIAKLQKARVIGIVRGAHGIAVTLLDNMYIAQHMLIILIIACFGVGIVAVNTVKLYRLIIEIGNIAPDFKAFEADFKRNKLAAAGNQQSIKLRIFAAPKLGCVKGIVNFAL